MSRGRLSRDRAGSCWEWSWQAVIISPCLWPGLASEELNLIAVMGWCAVVLTTLHWAARLTCGL